MDKPVVAAKKPAGVELTAGQEYWYCTCGQSKNQPFCDGSHKGTSFTPKSFTAEKDGMAYLCQCKQAEKAPFCDGTHKHVPAESIGAPFSLDDVVPPDPDAETPTVAGRKPIGAELKAGEEYFFCTCGRSETQPFCDGSHKGTSFTPKAFTAEADGEAWLCQCKQTGNAPFCDGSHKHVDG